MLCTQTLSDFGLSPDEVADFKASGGAGNAGGGAVSGLSREERSDVILAFIHSRPVGNYLLAVLDDIRAALEAEGFERTTRDGQWPRNTEPDDTVFHWHRTVDELWLDKASGNVLLCRARLMVDKTVAAAGARTIQLHMGVENTLAPGAASEWDIFLRQPLVSTTGHSLGNTVQEASARLLEELKLAETPAEVATRRGTAQVFARRVTTYLAR